MKRSIISNSITGIALAGILALVATRLPAADDAAIILPGTAGTTLAQEQKALRDARRQSVEAADRSVRLERQAGMARDEAEQAGRRAAAMAARIQQAEADVQAAQARIAIIARMQRAQAARLAARQEPVVRLTAALQMMSRRPLALALVQPGSISDAVHMRAVLGQVLPVIEQRTAGLRAELDRSRAIRATAQQAADALGALRARYVELASARAEIAAYGLGDRVMAELAPLTHRLDQARARLFIGEGVQAALLAAYSALAVMLVLLGADAAAPLVALALLASAGAVEAMAGLSRTAFRQASVDAGLARLAALDALPLEDTPAPSAATAQAIRLGGVELRPGARVAITGRSGSGKSLLAEGLAGLRPVTADVALGGHLLAACSGTTLRDQFALSPQDAPMLAGSVADNLRLARPGIDAADMADALHIACLDQRIASLPGGIDYRLGEAGGTLSGGERKRLSLARALLTGRPWLLLDEPTEGLDTATEALLISRLRIWLDRTGTGLILISHRPAPLTLTDRQVPVSAIAPLPGQGLPGVASAA
ncbi:ATP-binding cassette domain-containing protein [Sphingobium sp. IP1]|uniref:ATP-binding cassette domain-containing protein n=1 Tax=Sphingobium sp. IP1 TaxID=2021637 RepID=UPI00211EF59A|nr:ATP-binding cassette domain-containing protein [Sphingobium sp. IP1]